MAKAEPRLKHEARKFHRGTQAILGERTHLEEVLRSVQKAGLSRSRKQAEVKALTRMIRARTEELNLINPGWDRKLKRARNSQTPPHELLRLGTSLPADDYLLARVLTEHPNAPAELLEHLANHPYSATRENVARHPNTPAHILQRMADDTSEPLWFLVAFNPSTPPDLRERLRARLQQAAEQGA